MNRTLVSYGTMSSIYDIIQKYIYYANTNHKKCETPILKMDEIDFRNIGRDQERFIIRSPIYQEDITILNVHMLNVYMSVVDRLSAP